MTDQAPDDTEEPVYDGQDPGGLDAQQLDALADTIDEPDENADHGERGEGPPYYAGTACGGPEPYDGRLLVSRYPAGVLLIDKAAGWVWIYDYNAEHQLFYAREQRALDHQRRWRAADEPDYDVRAYDPDFAGDDAPQAVNA